MNGGGLKEKWEQNLIQKIIQRPLEALWCLELYEIGTAVMDIYEHICFFFQAHLLQLQTA